MVLELKRIQLHNGNWILDWRRRWDSNPRTGYSPVYPISSRGRYDHFDTPPCIFRQRSNLNPEKNKKDLERTNGKNYGILNFRAREKPHRYGICAIRNAQSQRRFRVVLVMTSSIALRISQLFSVR